MESTLAKHRLEEDGPSELIGLRVPSPTATAPLYHQLKLALTDHIVSGRWPPGTELPSEPELCRHFAVSRGTLRRALGDLATQGLISRQQGRGTFVGSAKFEGSVLASYAFYRAGAINHDRESKVVRCELRQASEELRLMLDLGPGEAIWELERVQSMQGVPVTLATSFLPAALCPDLDRQDIAGRLLYGLLESAYGLALLRAEESIEPVLADDYVAERLDIDPGTPVFQIERRSFGHGDRVKEFRRSFMRGDRYKLRIDLR
jgi:GntR family transcriptional regulator